MRQISGRPRPFRGQRRGRSVTMSAQGVLFSRRAQGQRDGFHQSWDVSQQITKRREEGEGVERHSRQRFWAELDKRGDEEGGDLGVETW